jgi:small subunit ribosomal protein S16
MSVKIRLQRHGKKGKPFFHIVVADARAPRDGRYIERLGIYNPNTNPATIDLNVDKTLDWVFKGAQPSDTCRAILSYKGVMMKKYLQEGVRKGMFDQAEADKRFEQWLVEKDAKVSGKKTNLLTAKQKATADRLAAEAKVKTAREEAILKKNSPVAEEVAEEIAEETTEATEETAADTAENAAE